jgi:carbonic anhydrase
VGRTRYCVTGALIASLLGSMLVLPGCASSSAEGGKEAAAETTKEVAYVRPDTVTNPEEALKLLEQGNERFAQGELSKKELGDKRRQELYAEQKPFAVILTCSDSRVPPEHIFDQGLGDIFIVRVAGNVIDPVTLGSIEYGAEHLKAPLVVVLGHESCGAVKATVAGQPVPGSIGSIAQIIKPSVDLAKATGASGTGLLELSAENNVRSMMGRIEGSKVIEELVKAKKLKVVGAKYRLSSGKVEWMKE